MGVCKTCKRMLALCLVAAMLLFLPQNRVHAAPSQDEVNEKIRWIVAGIPDDCDTDHEKSLYFFKYLCNTVVYERDRPDEAYTALIDGVADCGGYAEAYTKLMRAVGIQCCTIIGFANGDSHAWNMVSLDGKCYFTDVCWGDNEAFDFINYKYFMISYEEMEKDHSAFKVLRGTMDFDLPEECNHTQYAYAYLDTGRPGSGHFNNATTPEEAAKRFQVVKVDGSTVTWQCDFQFDGDASEWVAANRVQIGKILGGYADLYSGYVGYGLIRYRSSEAAFTPIEAIAFTEPIVHLNDGKRSHALSLAFTPADASYQNVTYISSDSRIAKVDEDGVVRAISDGTATVTAVAVDGKTAMCQVVVEHTHNAIRQVAASPANCLNKGFEAHYICDSCGTRFADAEGKNPVSIMDVVIPTTNHITRVGKHDADSHWIECVCGASLSRWPVSHEDWTGDGVCDGEKCGYVMNPTAVNPAQPTTTPTQPATIPTQPTTTPTQPTTVPTQPTTVPTQPTTPMQPTSFATVPSTESIPGSTPGATEATSSVTSPTTKQTVNPGSSAAPTVPDTDAPGSRWIFLMLAGVVAVAAALLIYFRHRRR